MSLLLFNYINKPEFKNNFIIENDIKSSFNNSKSKIKNLNINFNNNNLIKNNIENKISLNKKYNLNFNENKNSSKCKYFLYLICCFCNINDNYVEKLLNFKKKIINEEEIFKSYFLLKSLKKVLIDKNNEIKRKKYI